MTVHSAPTAQGRLAVQGSTQRWLIHVLEGEQCELASHSMGGRGGEDGVVGGWKGGGDEEPGTATSGGEVVVVGEQPL